MNQYFITAAYAVTWLVILGYVVRLGRKASRVRHEYDRMDRQSAGDTP
jgi:CcmD family protein